MNRKLWTSLKVSAAAAVLVTGFSAGSITSEAREVPYYNITTDGGTFDGQRYTTKDGVAVTDCFFCDGTYTYYLQYDGTPMKDRLTYHPDGEQVIYFDAKGQECFDTFANVRQSIEGKPVDDLCYFGTFGNLYVNVITYNKEGTTIYYANPYGVMERGGVFELNTNATNYELLANGCHYGFANSDGSVQGFYATYEEAAAHTDNSTGNNGGTNGSDQQQGEWKCIGSTTYDQNGNVESRTEIKDATTYIYVVKNGVESLGSERTTYVDGNGKEYGYTVKEYSQKEDGTSYLIYMEDSRKPATGDWQHSVKMYDKNGQETSSKEEIYSGSDVQKELHTIEYSGITLTITTIHNYSNGREVSRDEHVSHEYAGQKFDEKDSRVYCDYDSNGMLAKERKYDVKDGVETLTGYSEYTYSAVAGKLLNTESREYEIDDEGTPALVQKMLYAYDANGNQTNKQYFNGEGELRTREECEYNWKDDKWIMSKYLIYSNGTEPTTGYQIAFNFDGNNDRYMYYQGGPDKQWQLLTYEDRLNHYDMPQDTSKIASIVTSRVYSADGTCTDYTIENFQYVQ